MRPNGACRARQACAVCLAILLTACSHSSRPSAPALAILRFENLSADPSFDWLGRALSEIVSAQLEGSADRFVVDVSSSRSGSAPGISTEWTWAAFSGANQLLYGQFYVVHNAIHVSATLEDLATHRMTSVISASGPVENGIFQVADALARQLGRPRAFGTANLAALRAYVTAVDSADPAVADQALVKATAEDPSFARAYILRLETALALRDHAAAEHLITEASAYRERFPPLERARLDFEAAVSGGDFQARLNALNTLARVDPMNPGWHRALAEAFTSQRSYEGALAEFRRTLALRPADIQALNEMGYAAAYSGDLPTAIRVLRGYEQLRPNEGNPLDSLGDVHFMLGHFSEAERFYLAARDKSPAFLGGGEFLKAAEARLMTGDIPGATKLFNRFLAERRAAADPFADFHAANWSWHVGSRRLAVQSLDRLARAAENGPQRPLASRADSQAAIWLRALGDQESATRHARHAVMEAPPGGTLLAQMVAYAVEPADTAEPVQPILREYARAYACLFNKQFAQALPVLQEIYRRPAAGPDEGLSVLLAWACEETGEWREAEPLLRSNPVPDGSGLPLFSALFFPRLFFLRGVLLDRQGQHPQAARNYQLFRSLSGQDATIWDEEGRIRL